MIDGVVYGYYPTDENGNGQFDVNELFNSKGQMHINTESEFSDAYSGNAVTSFDVKISNSQAGDLLKILNTVAQSPGIYSLAGNNCTSVAINALIGAGVHINSFGPIKVMAGGNNTIFGIVPLQNGYGFSPSGFMNTIQQYGNQEIFYNPTHFYVK